MSLAEVAKKYAVKMTDHVSGLAHIPAIAKQYQPDIRELNTTPDEDADPIGDDAHSPVKGIVHRYPDRVLLKLIHICAVYCRYCFRREMVGPNSDPLRPAERNHAIDYIRNNKQIWEVILTGGDPLVLSARQLKETMDELCAMEHVKVIRLHTRIPAADPARITDDICDALHRDKAVYVAIHINHPDELTDNVKAAIHKLHGAGCVLLSQSVLLKDVNDDADTLEKLFRDLAALRVKPYYLHHPDKAQGTSHFRLPIKRGQNIMRQLLGRVSGLCRPHYMLDIPGGHGKIPLDPTYIEECNEHYTAQDFRGIKHRYDDN